MPPLYSVLGLHNPAAIPELMAYMSTIIRVSQDFEGLAWERYDAAFRRQAAATGNRRWSRINSSLYSICFTTCATKRRDRCELCLATTHNTRQCTLQGNPDPELDTRVKAVESVLVALAPSPGQRAGSWQSSQMGQACRLWNRNAYSYPRCRFSHVCSSCGGPHQAMFCQGQKPGGMAGKMPAQGTHLPASRARGRPY